MKRKILLNAHDLMTLITETITLPKLKGKLRGGREYTKNLITESIISDIKGDYKKYIRESSSAQRISERLSSYKPSTDSFIINTKE
jgi:hypothetical protein